jgi:hypothetical protein
VPDAEGYEGIYQRYKWAKVMADRLANDFVEQVLTCAENDPSALSATAMSYLASDWLNKLSSITGYIRHYEPIVRRHHLWMYDREFSDDHGLLTYQFEFDLMENKTIQPLPEEMLLDVVVEEREVPKETQKSYHLHAELSLRNDMKRVQCFLVRSSVLSGYMGGYGSYRIFDVRHDVEHAAVFDLEVGALDARDGVSLVVLSEFTDGRPPEVFGKELIRRQRSA